MKFQGGIYFLEQQRISPVLHSSFGLYHTDCLAATAFDLLAQTLLFLWCLNFVGCWEICHYSLGIKSLLLAYIANKRVLIKSITSFAKEAGSGQALSEPEKYFG